MIIIRISIKFWIHIRDVDEILGPYLVHKIKNYKIELVILE